MEIGTRHCRFVDIFTVMFYGQPVKDVKTNKTWQKTPVQYLVRHKSRRYYARLFAGGKEVWKSLGTSQFQCRQS
ncbi:MAG TPA: hypothetical protein VFX07_00980 [Candidatus Udaeobacter sp.]|jgi:hypothetical protein|nr:hypothetical protein [Candidatus Udaeobacter sp.]